MKLFWPKTGITPSKGDLLGWKVGGTLVAVSIGGHHSSSTQQSRRVYPDVKSVSHDLAVIARVLLGQEQAEAGYDGLIIWIGRNGEPVATNQPVELILFDPPDPTRLRFLTLGTASPTTSNKLERELSKQDGYSIGRTFENTEDTLENIIPLLNRVHRTQLELHSSRATSAGAIPPPLASHERFRGVLSILDTSISSILAAARGFSLGGIRMSPRHSSSAVAQICLRLEQVMIAPEIWNKARPQPGVDLAERSKHYMLFWNTIWLVLNDLILGYCTRQAVLQVTPVIGPHIKEAVSRYLVKAVVDALQWLNDWPVGLKLNTPLSQFLCTTLGITIQSWGDAVLPAFDTLIPIFLHILSLAAFGGLTLVLAILSDTLNLLTFHLYLCSITTQAVSKWQLSSLGGLWNLFRGKRWNILRQRTDSYAYEVDQLFLGTLLFTVSIFLLPTVLTYGALFALIRLGILVVQKVLRLFIMSLNAFPLFELMLRIKEPSRLPAGVTFSVRCLDIPTTPSPGSSLVFASGLEIKNAPKSLLDIFRRKS